ncbi:hypothetical protein ACFWXK_39385 [Streptomyces sp. NPDC059070]|uniref:hypothetical protein n=1 Tax=Streptomyces sp. NPDC059070 TaxID=3346713 RepID=UPI0036B198ED
MTSWLLRLYPADFRREFGAEMTEAYREATEGAGPYTRLREAADIAAHASRLRLRLGSAHRGGRLFAATAPFALAATAAYASFNVVGTLADWYGSQNPDFMVPLSYLTTGCYLLALMGAVAALCGRFASGARCALLGMAGATTAFLGVMLSGPRPLPAIAWPYLLVPVAIAALPLACPPDLRPPPRVRTATGTVALMLWVPLCAGILALLDPGAPGLLLPWRFGTPLLTLALVHRSAWSGIRTPGRLVLAALPFLGMGLCAGTVDQDTLLPLTATLAVAAVALRLRRRGDSGTASSA